MALSWAFDRLASSISAATSEWVRSVGSMHKTIAQAIGSDFQDPQLLDLATKVATSATRTLTTTMAPISTSYFVEPMLTLQEEVLGILNEINKGIVQIADSVDGISPEVTVAGAESEIRLLLAKFNRADEIGARLGRITELRGEMSATLLEISTNISKVALPVAEDILEKVNGILNFLLKMTDILPLETLGLVLSHLDDGALELLKGISPAAKILVELLEKLWNYLSTKQEDEVVDQLAEIEKFLTTPLQIHGPQGGPRPNVPGRGPGRP